MPRKVPMRTCIGCGTCKEKKELIRIVHGPDGRIRLDRTGRAQGRGAYLCDDPECFEKAVKRKSLNRAFGCPVDPADIAAIREAFAGPDGAQSTEVDNG